MRVGVGMPVKRPDQRSGLCLIALPSRTLVPCGKFLSLLREIIDEWKTLGETHAGIAVAGDLYKASREHERQLRDLENDLKSRLAKTDAVHAEELRELKAEIQEEDGQG